MSHGPTSRQGSAAQAGLVVASLGIVFGDLGTSPLYTLQECFTGAHGVPPTRDNVLGILSLVRVENWSGRQKKAL